MLFGNARPCRRPVDHLTPRSVAGRGAPLPWRARPGHGRPRWKTTAVRPSHSHATRTPHLLATWRDPRNSVFVTPIAHRNARATRCGDARRTDMPGLGLRVAPIRMTVSHAYLRGSSSHGVEVSTSGNRQAFHVKHRCLATKDRLDSPRASFSSAVCGPPLHPACGPRKAAPQLTASATCTTAEASEPEHECVEVAGCIDVAAFLSSQPGVTAGAEIQCEVTVAARRRPERLCFT